MNGAVATRGTPADFAEWVAMGNSAWSFEHVLPFYRHLENDREFGHRPVHGDSGPVSIIRYAPEQWPPVVRTFGQACLDLGFPESPDYNAPDARGIGPMTRNQAGDLRGSTLVTYLRAARDRPNLAVRAEATVTRIVFDGRRAVGVEVRDGAGELETLRADRVVLSAGAIKTPQLLQLSGVGPQDVLHRFGIEPVAELEGVGHQLLDQPYVPLLAVPREDSDLYGFRAALVWGEEGGPIEFNCLASVIDVDSLNFDTPPGVQSLFLLPVSLGKPVSTGHVSLTSLDPDDSMDIHVGFLSDRRDLERMTSAVKTVYDILMATTAAGAITSIIAPDEQTMNDPDRLEQYIRASVNTMYHPAGTCRMGPDDDPLAVVGQHLDVRGVSDLYIADASVMPTLPFGFTNLTCYMIGERMASWLKNGLRED